jgi:receptor protein-tyrosine kinase
MSVISKLFRLKKDPVKTLDPPAKALDNLSVNKPISRSENGLDKVYKSASDNMNLSASSESKKEGEVVEIDIPLNQDSSGNYAGFEQLKDNNIDFDLTDLGGDETKYPTSHVLDFNPLKTFSQPVELDLLRLQDQGFITPHNVNTLLGNTFRMIKRPLLNNVMGKGATVLDNANLIMVTSSISGEGKTFSAINLAISIAMERDKQVLLIDADVNKPSHHDVFGFKAEFGLTDYLRGKVTDMSRILYKSSIPSLTLMPAGTKTSHATELIASEAMEHFVEDISSKYKNRVIIFDSPPLLLPTEASVLASHMGQVIVVVQAEKTRHQEVKKSLSMLSNKIVLLMLNQSHEKTQIGNYGYYKYEDQA